MWNTLLNNLKREKLLALTNILAMTITFLLLGIFIFVVALSHTALKQLESQAQLTVFFKDDYPENDILQLKTALERDARVSNVLYVSKEDAFKIFTEIHKDEPTLLKAASPSILPASLEVKTRDLSQLSLLSDELSQKDGVEEVKFYKEVIERFRSWGNIIYVVGFALVSLFLIISYSVILVTLRLTISSKGTELEVLKLVGASDSYVKSPLLFQGIFFGGISAAVSALLLFIFSIFAKLSGALGGTISFAFLTLDILAFSILLGILLIVSGSLLGYFGSQMAVKKYLKY